jgi:hypothetical protein
MFFVFCFDGLYMLFFIQLNACIEVLSRNHDELTTVDQIRSAYLPALLINLCSMKSSFSQMFVFVSSNLLYWIDSVFICNLFLFRNFRHSDLVSLWYCVYQLSALSAIKHEAALESIYVDLIESASSNLSSSLCFRYFDSGLTVKICMFFTLLLLLFVTPG